MSIIRTDGVIFDLDGTLWDSTKEIADAWNVLIDKKGGVGRDKITAEELHHCMGLPMYGISAKLFPHLSEEERNNLMDEMGVFENDYLRIQGAPLYPGIMDTIRFIAAKVPVFIVSNCQSGYIEAFMHYYGLTKTVKDIECWGNTRNTKGDNIKSVVERNGLKSPVYIGDTVGDSKASREAGVPFVYAAYGFGDTDEYEEKVSKASDIVKILEFI